MKKMKKKHQNFQLEFLTFLDLKKLSFLIYHGIKSVYTYGKALNSL